MFSINLLAFVSAAAATSWAIKHLERHRQLKRDKNVLEEKVRFYKDEIYKLREWKPINDADYNLKLLPEMNYEKKVAFLKERVFPTDWPDRDIKFMASDWEWNEAQWLNGNPTVGWDFKSEHTALHATDRIAMATEKSKPTT